MNSKKNSATNGKGNHQANSGKMEVFSGDVGNASKQLIQQKAIAMPAESQASTSLKAAFAVKTKAMKFVDAEGHESLCVEKESAKQTFGTADPDLILRLLHQVNVASPEIPLDGCVDNSLLAALHGIAPRDALEGMLAVQLLAAHNNALAFLQRARRPGQPGTVAYVNLATRLMRSFTAGVEALTKYRDNSPKNTLIEQVHVHQGAQAIVGSIRRLRRTATIPEAQDEKLG
jgi:hypothetical protein